MSSKNFLSQEHYDLLMSLNEYRVNFSDDEVFIYKLGLVPRDTICFLLNGKVDIQIEQVICVREDAQDLLGGLPVSFNILNNNRKALSLRFGIAQSITKKEITSYEALFMIEEQIKHIVQNIQLISKSFGIKEKDKQYQISVLHEKYLNVTDIKNQLQFTNADFTIFKSNELKQIMYGYVYVDHKDAHSQEVNKKFHLSKFKPNIIIINNDYKNTFNKRTRNTSKLSFDKIVTLEETSPFDIFISFGNKITVK